MAIPSNDPRHGSTKGYYAGCREPCCRDALNAYERRRRKLKQVYGIEGWTSPVGSARRVQGLMLMGWTATEIALEAGFTHRNTVLDIQRRTRIRPVTARRVARACDRMCMRVPPPNDTRGRNRRYAIRQGWAPILSWDDIDDPDDTPRGIRAA